MPPRPTSEESLPGSLAPLLGAGVRVGTVRVGEVVGVFLRGSDAIGLEVMAAQGARLFLPWFAARLDPDGVRIESAFLLVDAVESYERHGALPVRDAASLALLQVTREGAVERLDEPAEHASALP
jgi:hypothetical protein